MEIFWSLLKYIWGFGARWLKFKMVAKKLRAWFLYPWFSNHWSKFEIFKFRLIRNLSNKVLQDLQLISPSTWDSGLKLGLISDVFPLSLQIHYYDPNTLRFQFWMNFRFWSKSWVPYFGFSTSDYYAD